MSKVLMHKESMDIAFKIITSIEIGERGDGRHRTVLIGDWLNLGYTGNPWIIKHSARIEIPQDQMCEWVDITDKYKKKRTSPGLPI